MNSEDIFAIILAFLIISGIIWVIYHNTKTYNRIKKIIKNHPKQAAVLLDKPDVETKMILSKKERLILFSITEQEWNEWDYLISKAKSISSKYTNIFGVFLKSNFNNILNRKCYLKPNLFSTQKEKNERIIDAMNLSELRIIESESDNIWEERDKENKKADEIRKLFPNGINTLKKIDKIKDFSDSEIIRNEKRLEQYQIMYEKAAAYEGWKEKQEEFCKLYRKLLKEQVKSGYYNYEVKIKMPKENGTLYDESFKIWQGFLGAFCEYYKEVQNDNYRDWLDKHLINMKNQVSYYADSNYDNLFKIIQEIEDEHEYAPLTIFVTESKRNWPKKSYNYHYNRIKSLLNNDGYITCDLKNLNNISCYEKWKSVIIIDLITSNEEMLNNVSLVAEYFHKFIPVIGYFSIIKEYSEEEGKEIFKKNYEDLEYIRQQYERVQIDDYYSYMAITNTLVGNASGSKGIKQIWLTNPDEYIFETDGNYKLAGQYSTDGGNTYNSFSIDGDYNSFEDNVLFAYRLFEKMDIMKMFRQKGKSAIDEINNKEMLS